MIRFNAPNVTLDAAAPDGTDRRTFTGVAVPYGVPATVADGTSVIFAPGSLPTDGKPPRVFMYHQSDMPVGIVTERIDTPEGMLFTAKLSKTTLADEALTLAKDGVIDSVSVGVNPIKATRDDNGNLVIESAAWIELSLVPIPAYAGATIDQVFAAASIHQNDPDDDNNNDQEPDQENEPVSNETFTEIAAEAPALIPTPALPAVPKRKFAMPTPGEYLAAMHVGGDTFARVNEAYVEAAKDSMSAYQFALAQDLTTDTPGLLPTPVVGPVFQDLNFVRPVVSAFGTRAMPNGNGKAFIRPTISQHTAAGTQTEGAAVTSQKMTIASNTVTRSTVAGGVFISQQDMDFSDPAAMDQILRDLAGEYLIKTDDIAADALVAGATASGSTWTVNQTDPTSLVSSLYDAAREIAEDSNFFPTHLFVDPTVWEKLGRQLDADKRPVFGYTSNGLLGMNTIGNVNGIAYTDMNVLGLRVVVDNNFAAGTMLVTYAPGFEVYENVRGIMTKDDPELLGRNFTYYGYFSTFVAKSSFIQSIVIA